MGEVILTMKGIDKTFPGVHALVHVDFEVRSGEVHALMGENGAGKSTLIKVLTGVYTKDAGDILIGFVTYPVNQALLQLELVLEADKLEVLNKKTLRQSAK